MKLLDYDKFQYVVVYQIACCSVKGLTFDKAFHRILNAIGDYVTRLVIKCYFM